MKILYSILDSGIQLLGSKGASAHVRSLAKALNQVGNDVLVASRSIGGSEPPLPKEIRVVNIPADETSKSLGNMFPRSSNELTALFQNPDDYDALTKLVQKERPEAILERLSLFSIAPLAVSKRFGIPFLLEVDAPISDEAATFRGLGLYDTARFIEREVLLSADAVFPVSTALSNWLIREGVEPRRIQLLSNGVDTGHFDPTLAKDRRDVLGFQNDHVMGFVGGLRPWHGLRLLTEIFELVAEQDPKAKLLVVGDGPGRENLEQWRSTSKVGDRARFVGHVSHSDVRDYLATMDVVLVPYEVNSNFYFSPLKLLEAMSMGRPTVASAVGDIPSLLGDASAGIIVPPGDAEAFALAARRLLEDQNLSSKIGKAARNAALRFHDWRDVARSIEAGVRAIRMSRN